MNKELKQTTILINDKIQLLRDLYLSYGQSDYIGEDINQVEHAVQAAMCAEKEGYDDEMILAAFYHDIGHLMGLKEPQKYQQMGKLGVHQHELIGKLYLLDMGFPLKMCNLIENHVKAKRYLVWKHKEYYESLSEASKGTLKFQGGPLTEEEALEFEKQGLLDLSIKLREFDDQAKVKDMKIQDVEYYFQKSYDLLNKKQIQAN